MKQSLKGLERSYGAIQELAGQRQVVLFGAGPIAGKVAKHLKGLEFSVVDNSRAIQGTDFEGRRVLAPKAGIISGGAQLVVVCTTAVSDVLAQLHEFGLDVARQVAIPPHLANFLPIEKLKSFTTQVLFTSGAAGPSETAPGAGGLFITDFPDLNEPRQILSGACHGLIRLDDGTWLVTTDDHGVVRLDSDLQVVANGKIPQGWRPHGVTVDEAGMPFVVASGRDSVLALNTNLAVTDEIPLRSSALGGRPQHHANDIAWQEGRLFVSMFSRGGNWRQGIYDGVVAEINLQSRQLGPTVVRDLYMPHSVSFFEEQLYVLDSLRGDIRGHNAEVLGHFPAFARGLDFVDGFMLVGQSQNRNSGLVMGTSNNISVDTAITLFDPLTKLSTTSRLPAGFSEIHAVRHV